VLTIASYNLQRSRNIELLIKNIVIMKKGGINIFCLQEVSPNIFPIILSELGKQWKGILYNTHEPDGTAIIWDTNCLKVRMLERVNLPQIKHLGLHEFLISFLFGWKTTPVQRQGIRGYFFIKNKEICISSLHLDHVGGARHRTRQLKYFLNIQDEQKRKLRHIICGDFNSFDFLNTGKELYLFNQTLGTNYTDASVDSGITADLFHMDFIKNKWLEILVKKTSIHVAKKLDYIWVKGVNGIFFEKKQMLGSDHFPIVATISLN
jgi:endonuclease/exonuclease/phosphatase family metal-dependent hydrolase